MVLRGFVWFEFGFFAHYYVLLTKKVTVVINPFKNKANPKDKKEFLQKGVSSCLACLYLYNLCKLSIIDTHFVLLSFCRGSLIWKVFVYLILVLCPRNQQTFLSWRVKERRQRAGELKGKKENFQT